MKTSNEIKEFIKQSFENKKYVDLYFEIFEELKDVHETKDMKALNYRWMAACKELNYKGLDETFFRSIVCYNTVCNFQDQNTPRHIKALWKRETGWDAENITNGKHCKLAQAIIDALKTKRCSI